MSSKQKKIKSKKEMLQKWEAYKEYCNSFQITQTQFSQRESRFVTQGGLPHGITYTIKGFAIFIGISRRVLVRDYFNKPEYSELYEMIKDECEIDARTKFELGVLDPKLAALWMYNYDYGKDSKLDALPVRIINDIPRETEEK